MVVILFFGLCLLFYYFSISRPQPITYHVRQPSNLQSTLVQQQNQWVIKLTWLHVSPQTEYAIYLREQKQNFQLETVTASSHHMLTNLKSGLKYEFFVVSHPHPKIIIQPPLKISSLVIPTSTSLNVSPRSSESHLWSPPQFEVSPRSVSSRPTSDGRPEETHQSSTSSMAIPQMLTLHVGLDKTRLTARPKRHNQSLDRTERSKQAVRSGRKN